MIASAPLSGASSPRSRTISAATPAGVRPGEDLGRRDRGCQHPSAAILALCR